MLEQAIVLSTTEATGFLEQLRRTGFLEIVSHEVLSKDYTIGRGYTYTTFGEIDAREAILPGESEPYEDGEYEKPPSGGRMP